MNFYWYSAEISFISDRPLALTGFKVNIMFGGFHKADIQGSIPYGYYGIAFPLAEEVEEDKEQPAEGPLDERVYGRKPLPKYKSEDNLFKYFRAVSFYFVVVGVLLALLAENRRLKLAGGLLSLLPLAILLFGMKFLPLCTKIPGGLNMIVNLQMLEGGYLLMAGGLLIIIALWKVR